MKTIIMKKEDHEKWDAALRSGEYEQGTNRLQMGRKFCCLGVLQMVLDGRVETCDLRTHSESMALPSHFWLQNHFIKFLNKKGCEDSDQCAPYLESMQMTADAANDYGRSFEEIADAIKECVEYVDA